MENAYYIRAKNVAFNTLFHMNFVIYLDSPVFRKSLAAKTSYIEVCSS